VPFATLEQILAAMPTERRVAKGIRRPSFSRLRVAVILHTGIPPAELQKLRAIHFDRAAATVKMPWRDKGGGTPAHVRELSAAGVAAFVALDAAGAWGAFAPERLSASFKRAARQVCGPDTPIRLYDLRHTLGADTYRTTHDLATVGRLLGHVPGSIVTQRYAMGAHAEVDRAALAKLTAARSLPAKLARRSKAKQPLRLAEGF
jgi:integrase